MSRRRKPPSGGNYAVGYGKPPEQHRFKPGNSGRPKGSRNKQSAATTLTGEAIIAELMRRKTRVKRGDRIVEIGFRETIVARLHTLVMQGTARDLTTVLAFAERYMPQPAAGDDRLDVVLHRADQSDVILPSDDLWRDPDA